MSPRLARRAAAATALALAFLAGPGRGALGGEPPPPAPAPEPPKPSPVGPPVVVEVPVDEMDVLVKAQGKGVLLRYAEYRALLDEARAREKTAGGAPPEDAVRTSGVGRLDLTDERAARFEIVYRVEGLAPGPRSLGFEAGGLAFESVRVEPEPGAGPGRYEERDGHGRIYLDGPGVRTVTVTGSAVPTQNGASRGLDLWLPNPAAMSLSLVLPPGVLASIEGEGPVVTARSAPEAPLTVPTRPSRGGHLVVSWAQAARGTDGPSVLDADVRTLYAVGVDLIGVRALVHVDALRTPVASIALDVPADLAVHSVEGPGVTGTTRSEDRRRLTVALEKPTLGAVEVLLQGERPSKAGPGLDLPRVGVEGASRFRGEVALLFGPDVKPRAVRVEGGRRVERPTPPPPAANAAPAAPDPRTAGALRYALARADATVHVDVEAVALRVDATSTCYLNLAEPGQTLIATITYRVAEGLAFALHPRFPREFDLRELTIDGRADGFTRDVAADGGVEIALGKGVPAGGEVVLLATLERARADWMPEREHARVTVAVPSSGATHEEGYVAVGADAGFEVLDAGAKDLVAVGAADLTARGLSSAGLVYGYRIDGASPTLELDVVRRTPLVEADVVTVLHPGPRRIDLSARAIYRIQRAGVRRLYLDLPASAGEQVDFRAPTLRAAVHLSGERRPADVAAGYERWQLDLSQRAVGTQVVTATWFLDRDADDWTLLATERVAARAPVERAERLLVVRRSGGLEVRLPSLQATPDVVTLDLAEAPAEAMLDPESVLEVLRLPTGRDGVEVGVKKHGGAAVLDAIATEVALTTAVSREGILRTRADLALANVDRQFVEVALPAGSTLVGAVVDGQPVKPLVDARGVLLVTVPSTLRVARSRDARAHVVLTYQTSLGSEAHGGARIEEPRFPGLEILHTTHEVGVEPEYEIRAVDGDFLPSGRLEAPPRTPWLLALLELPRGCGGAGGISFGVTKEAVEVRSGDASGYAVSRPEGKPRTSAGATPGHEGQDSNDSGTFYGTPAKPAPPRAAAPPPPPATPPTTTPPPAPAAGPDPIPRGDADMPTEHLVPADIAPAMGEPPPSGERDREGARGGRPAGGPGTPGGGGGKSGAEKGEAGESLGARRGGPGQKALLSLDVPVLLAPHRVIAARVGGGGVLEVEWTSHAAARRGYLFLGALALVAGLGVVAAGWLPGWLTVVAGLLAALVARLSFGASASTLVAALADAATLLAALLLVRRLAGWVARRLGRPPTRPRRRAAAPAATALVLGALLLAGAETARADDDPAPDVPAAERGAAAPAQPGGAGSTVFVPREPARGEGLSPDDRVFVPLAVWLELERKAHPDRDPEVVAAGRLATLVEATYGLDVAAKNAVGTAHLVFAQRGAGTLLVPVALPGLAVTAARLDGEPVRLLLDGAAYRVPLSKEGDHVLDLEFQAPVVAGPDARSFTFGAPTSVVSTMDLTAAGFDGDLRVSGAGRVAVRPREDGKAGPFAARAWLGRPVGTGPVQLVTVTLAERRPASLPAAVRTRAESRTVHSLRDGGTESVSTFDVHVLQGRAPFVDLSLPSGVDVLEATGPEVQRWETSPGRLRLVLGAPTQGKVSMRVRTFQAARAPEREETLPELAVRDTTGESGIVIVNGDPSMRLEAVPATGLLRTGRPGEPDATGPDGRGRVLGAWRFAARPAGLAVRVLVGTPRIEVTSRVRATFGDDRVRTVLEARVDVQRASVGELTFALPGADEVRGVEAPGLSTWWLEGTGEERRLSVRMSDLFTGERRLTLRLERRVGGARDALAVPRWALLGAQADRGFLALFALPDVEPSPGQAPGLRSLPPSRLDGLESDVPGARATHAFEWEAPVGKALAVALKAPEQEIEAVVVSQVTPSDEEQRLEHLVVFDVRRGAADRVTLFVPDGGLSVNDVVRARDLRELRVEKAVRTDADGKETSGLLYTVRLQSSKSGLVEVTVSQLWPAGTTVRVVRPEGVKATRWFGILRTFLDGEVDARVGAGAPDVAGWADLPFLPAGLEPTSVLRSYAARAPYTLELAARRHRIEAQSDAVVLAAHAEVVVGLDGDARVRMRYRLFNRARQFLRLRLPEGVVLYGASAAGQPVKPLAGTGGSVLLPVPKVPLGGKGYEVGIAYRAPAGRALREGGTSTLPLPEVEGVEVDRTSITLRVPEGLAYDFDTKMTEAAEREVLGDEVEASLREAQEVLKVAETGTLEQRRFACSNSTPLVEEARQKLSAYKAQGGRGTRVAGLEAEVARLSGVQQEAQARCVVDDKAAQSAWRFEANSALSANANGQAFVVLDPGAGTAIEESAPGQATTSNWNGNWKFNSAPTPQGPPAQQELAELKGRLQRELERRGDEERRKSVDVAKEEQSRAGKPQGQAPAGKDADDEKKVFDESRNNLRVNDRLRRVQAEQRQLGAAPTPQQAAPADLGGDGAMGDYRARTENVFDREVAGPSVTRAGLMGIDVPLPKDGRTFWFVGARTGSPVAFDASLLGMATWLRVLIGLALWSLLGVALVAVRRRLTVRR